MAITVRYFASIRESVGKSEELLDIKGISCVADVWIQVNKGVVSGSVLAAVNQDFAEFSHAVGDYDEVAFFPPVTGG